MDKLPRFRTLVGEAKGIIFDFDGLLADSEKYHYLAYSQVFARHGHTIDEREYYEYWTSLGHGARGEIERHDLDLDPVTIRNEKKPLFTGYCEDGSIQLFDEAADIIARFADSGKKMAIASGSSTHDIRAILANADIHDVFDTILGSDIVPAIKPAPDIFLKTLDGLDLDAGDCVVFEDAQKGMFAANTAAIPVVIVLTRETKTFDFSRADIVIESHAELRKLVAAALG